MLHFYCVDHNKLCNILKEMGIPEHLTFLLRNLYAGQESTVRTGHEQMNGSKMGKYVRAVYCHFVFLTYMRVLLLLSHFSRVRLCVTP